MSETKPKGPNDLSAKEIALYLVVIGLCITGNALQLAPGGVLIGVGAGAVVAIHFLLRPRGKPPDSN